MQQSLTQDAWLMVVRCCADLHMSSLFVTGHVEVAGSLSVDVPSCGYYSAWRCLLQPPPPHPAPYSYYGPVAVFYKY